MVLVSQISWGVWGNLNFTASCPNTLDPPMIFWAPPKDLVHISSSAFYSTVSSGWHHSTAAAVLVDYSTVLVSSIHGGLLLQLGFTYSLSQALFMVTKPQILVWLLHFLAINSHYVCNFIFSFHGLSQCQSSVALRNPFLCSKKSPWWFLHMTKFSCSMKYNLVYLWNTSSLWKNN